MITIKDIKTAIIQILRQHTDVTHIHAEQIKQKDFPFFYLTIKQLSATTAAAGYHVDKRILVDIAYVEEDETSNAKNQEVLECIDMWMRPCIRVKNRGLKFDKVDMDIADHVAHYKFMLEFTDISNRAIEDSDIPNMQHLAIKIDKKEGYDGVTRD